MPASATIADIKEIYMRAWRSGVKGTRSIATAQEGQVLTFMSQPGEAPGPPLRAEPECAGGCAGHACEF